MTKTRKCSWDVNIRVFLGFYIWNINKRSVVVKPPASLHFPHLLCLRLWADLSLSDQANPSSNHLSFLSFQSPAALGCCLLFLYFAGSCDLFCLSDQTWRLFSLSSLSLFFFVLLVLFCMFCLRPLWIVIGNYEWNEFCFWSIF